MLTVNIEVISFCNFNKQHIATFNKALAED